MDTEGARALAKRIASGPPAEDETTSLEERPAPPSPSPQEPKQGDAPHSDGVAYVKPRRDGRRDVRIYVRGRDGRLEPFDP